MVVKHWTSDRVSSSRGVLSAVLRPEQDAFGHLLVDLVAGRRAVEVVERDDAAVFTGDARHYLAPFRRWWPQERRAMRFARGRILDLGCGAGRVSLHLQNRGLGRHLGAQRSHYSRRRGVIASRGLGLGLVASRRRSQP